jgi:sugar O-acyltransferase (sialic acid O-acetyltransferase NeuD family)
MPKQAIIWGATGHAKVVKECLDQQGILVLALFDQNPALSSPLAGIPLYVGQAGFADWIKHYTGDQLGCVVAVGGDRGAVRVQIQRDLVAQGLEALTLVHSRAALAPNANLGSGSQILTQSAICVEASLGEACIINTGATVDHECHLGAGVHIAPGAHLAGCVSVGDCATIFTGATVLPRVKIGAHAIVGAGAVILNDVPPGAVVVGNPGRIISYREGFASA